MLRPDRPRPSNRLTLIAVPVALALGLSAGCAPGPRLKDRPKVDPAAAFNELAQRRAEAMRLAAQAEAVAPDEPSKAIELYRQALANDDSLHNAWNNLGTLLMAQGRYADAVHAFQAAADLMPADPRPMYNTGIAYQRNGWGEEAYRHFAMALERDPSHLPSMRGFVRAAEITGKADERTIEVIRRATMRETDERWRSYFQRQRYRVEAVLEEER